MMFFLTWHTDTSISRIKLYDWWYSKNLHIGNSFFTDQADRLLIKGVNCEKQADEFLIKVSFL